MENRQQLMVAVDSLDNGTFVALIKVTDHGTQQSWDHQVPNGSVLDSKEARRIAEEYLQQVRQRGIVLKHPGNPPAD